MAFASSNLRKVNVGGGLRHVVGTWTGSEGDATGTITFAGSKIYSGDVYGNGTSGTGDADWSWTVSGNIITVTVANIQAVTDGYFWFLVG